MVYEDGPGNAIPSGQFKRSTMSGMQGADDDEGFYFESLDEFVREFLRDVYRRRIDGRNRCWAGRWWESPEAIARLQALWQSWELQRLEPEGLSVWWRDHADYHMRILMDPEGPFSYATSGEENISKAGEPLPYVEPPPFMFPYVRSTRER